MARDRFIQHVCSGGNISGKLMINHAIRFIGADDETTMEELLSGYLSLQLDANRVVRAAAGVNLETRN
jgi:hypothetical protein